MTDASFPLHGRSTLPPAVGPVVALTQAAATGLDRRVRPTIELPDDAAPAVISEAVRARLTGHLVAALDAKAITASASVRAAAVAAHRRVLTHALLLEQALLNVVEVLTAVGVETRVLKGPAVARTLYPQLAVRTFVDVDVLVRSEDMDGASAALAAAGYRRPVPELQPGFDRRFGKSVMFVSPDGVQVDLHRTLVVGPFGLLVDLRDLFATARHVTVGGRTVTTVGSVPELLTVCYHAALGDVPPRLASLRDVAQAVQQPSDTFDAALEMAARWRGRAVVARAVTMAASAFDMMSSRAVAWARTYRTDHHDRRLLACYVSARGGNARKYLASARVMSSPLDMTAYLAALLFPRPDVLAVHRRDRGRWLWHGVRSLLGTATRDADAPVPQP